MNFNVKSMIMFGWEKRQAIIYWLKEKAWLMKECRVKEQPSVPGSEVDFCSSLIALKNNKFYNQTDN